MAYPSTRGWGGPGCTSDQLGTVLVAGIPMRLRKEVVPLFQELVRWLIEERRHHGKPALSSSGGYNKRYIAGTTTWSNYAWGLAGDFNAATNPYSYSGGTDMPPGTSEKAKSLGMRWGGDYTGKKDAMHFEFMGTPADAARIARSLGAVVTPSQSVPAPSIPKPRAKQWNELLVQGDFGPGVGWLQDELRRVGFDPGPRDEDFGPKVGDALEAFQRAAGIDADRKCGEDTRAELISTPNFPGVTRQGMNDSHVTRMYQQRLRDRGWRISVDGDHGPKTTSILRQFQAVKKLAVDGVGGESTWVALYTRGA